ncbi:MAG: DUF4845 domain-containing protein [Xanthomonadaceae bacterium]|nr:DUF4845 domain-containing protein [Xanthomonadaceae bacterium]
MVDSESRGITVKRNQSGISLSGFLVTLIVLIFVVFIGMRLFPIYQSYFAVRSVMKEMAAEARSGSSLQPAQMQEEFFRRLYINYSDDAVKRENIKFQQLPNGWRMQVDYESRRTLIGNLDVVGKFDTAEDLIRGSGGN